VVYAYGMTEAEELAAFAWFVQTDLLHPRRGGSPMQRYMPAFYICRQGIDGSVSPVMTACAAGEWVRFADVPQFPEVAAAEKRERELATAALRQKQAAERERDAARAELENLRRAHRIVQAEADGLLEERDSLRQMCLEGALPDAGWCYDTPPPRATFVDMGQSDSLIIRYGDAWRRVEAPPRKPAS